MAKGLSTDDRGFILLSVLALTSIVSALLIVAWTSTGSHLRTLALENQIGTARWIADAGIRRVMLALENDERDTLKRLQKPDAYMTWEFAGSEIKLTLRPESGKIDLNAGDLQLVSSAINALPTTPENRRAISDRLVTARTAGRPISSPGELLSEAERYEDLGDAVSALFTVYSGMKGIDFDIAGADVLKLLPGIMAEELDAFQALHSGQMTPLLISKVDRFNAYFSRKPTPFRVGAEVRYRGAVVRREALLSMDARSRRAIILRWGGPGYG